MCVCVLDGLLPTCSDSSSHLSLVPDLELHFREVDSLYLGRFVLSHPCHSLSCAPCLWGPQTLACLPLWRVAPIYVRCLFPGQVQGIQGPAGMNGWVCWSILPSSDCKCPLLGLPGCSIILRVLGTKFAWSGAQNWASGTGAKSKSVFIAFVISTFPLIISDSLIHSYEFKNNSYVVVLGQSSFVLTHLLYVVIGKIITLLYVTGSKIHIVSIL